MGLSARQVRRKLRAASVATPTPSLDYTLPVTLVIDTTYFDTYGVMVFRCWKRRRNLLWYFVDVETVEAYLAGMKELEARGYVIASVTVDGKTWLKEALKARGYPVQLCQFHLMKTVTRYLTRHPLLPAGIALRHLTLTLSHTNRDVFSRTLIAWHEQWDAFLKERTIDPYTGRWCYTHRRIRGAYAVIQQALSYLFTFEEYPKLDVPKTTNTLDGSFSHLKQKIRVHRGLNRETEQKMVSTILASPSTPKTN